MASQTFTGNGTWPGYIGIVSIDVVCIGAGQAGEDGLLVIGGRGGVGGDSAFTTSLSVTENTSQAVVVGAGGATSFQAGGDSSFGSSLVVAKGGGSGTSNVGGTTHTGGTGNAAGGGGGGAGNGSGGSGDGTNAPGSSGGGGGTGSGGVGGSAGSPGGNGGDGTIAVGSACGGGGGGDSNGATVGNGGVHGGGGGGSSIGDDLFGVGGRGVVLVVWTYPTPAPLYCSPSGGLIAGGTSITIKATAGTFSTGCTVTVGGSAATSVSVVDSSTITCVTPAHAVGVVNVVVTNADSTGGTLSNGFTYYSGASGGGGPVVGSSIVRGRL